MTDPNNKNLEDLENVGIESNYKKHYTEFSQNIGFAIRTWHHSLYLDARAKSEPKILEALNKAPRFWLDYRYSNTQATVIFLGMIFDEDSRTHNIYKMLNLADKEIGFFSKVELRKRKSSPHEEPDWLDEYIENAHELTREDLKLIRKQVKSAQDIWNKIKPLRNKIFAHNEILTDDERNNIIDAVKKTDMTNILQILLNVSNSLHEAELNGRKPDFSDDYQSPIKWAENDIESLISSLKL